MTVKKTAKEKDAVRPKKAAAKKEKADKRVAGCYLIVADKTEEFSLALHYAVKQAAMHSGRVAILRVADIQDFQHWGDIEARLRREHRENAERFAWEMAKKVLDLGGDIPVIHISEGPLFQTVMDVIEEDLSIRQLILATSAQAGNPGPLVSYFVSKALSKIRVPLLIVPGHLSVEQVESLV